MKTHKMCIDKTNIIYDNMIKTRYFYKNLHDTMFIFIEY